MSNVLNFVQSCQVAGVFYSKCPSIEMTTITTTTTTALP